MPCSPLRGLPWQRSPSCPTQMHLRSILHSSHTFLGPLPNKFPHFLFTLFPSPSLLYTYQLIIKHPRNMTKLLQDTSQNPLCDTTTYVLFFLCNSRSVHFTITYSITFVNTTTILQIAHFSSLIPRTVCFIPLLCFTPIG